MRFLTIVFVLLFMCAGCATSMWQATAPASSDIVKVAPPTGEKVTDWANVQAAFDAVQPGGTVQFAAGTYLVGEIIHVTVPGITVLGHCEGKTLRGCDPTVFPLGGGFEVDGHPTGIGILVLRQGTSCRDNVIRDNTIRVARVRVPSSSNGHQSGFGIPIALVGSPAAQS